MFSLFVCFYWRKFLVNVVQMHWQSLYRGGTNKHQHLNIWGFFPELEKMCKYTCEPHCFSLYCLMVCRQWMICLFWNWITVCCWNYYIHFRLEKRLNLAFLLWTADLFWDCEIKTYLYFGLDHGFVLFIYFCQAVCAKTWVVYRLSVSRLFPRN